MCSANEIGEAECQTRAIIRLSSLLTHRSNLLWAHGRGEAGSKQFCSNSKTVLRGVQMKNAITVGVFIGTMAYYTGSCDCIVNIHDLFIAILRLLVSKFYHS